MQILKIRKLADTASGIRVTQYDAVTGQPYLHNPDTPGNSHEPWPLLGVQIEGEPPQKTSVSMRWAVRAVNEGWASFEGERTVRERGGPRHDPWAITHEFTVADYFIIHAMNSDIRYKITHNPGKYVDDNAPSGTRVDWFYLLELEQ